MNRWIDVLVDGWMNGWMDDFSYQNILTSPPQRIAPFFQYI